MNIYTKTGDDGETSLFGGKRLHKHHQRIESYGLVDELNAEIGMVLAHEPEEEVTKQLLAVQDMLMTIGSHLATPYAHNEAPDSLPPLEGARVAQLEEWIDAYDSELPALRNFILPGGTPAGAQLHVARAVCRRAERAVVALHNDTETEVHECILQYMNRLSDYLFVLSRTVNHRAGSPETVWHTADAK